MGNYTPVLLTAAEKILANSAYLSDSGLSSARDAEVQAWDALLTQCYNVKVQVGWLDPPTNSIPDYDYPNQSIINQLRSWIGSILAGNNRNFGLNMQIAFGHRKQMNSAINSTANANDIAASSFTSMDELTTGNISLVSTDPAAFGEDLANTGRLLNFEQLDKYGSPEALIRILAGTNMLETLRPEFEAVGININDMVATIVDTDSLPLVDQKAVYGVSATVTGKKLEDIMLVLGVETSGISTLADLMNTQKLFPNSYPTLRALYKGNPENIYTNIGVAQWVSAAVVPLQSVMPSSIAQANRAFSNAMQQIKGITLIRPSVLAEQAKDMELNTGLSSIENQTSAMDTGVQTSLLSTLAGGTGTNGEYTMKDVFGSIISSDVYETAVRGLISSPGNSTHISAISSQISKDQAFFAEAGGLSSGVTRKTALDLVSQLYAYAEDEEIADFILQVIKTGAGGDAIDAALREGRNQTRLRKSGVGSDLQINDLPKT